MNDSILSERRQADEEMDKYFLVLMVLTLFLSGCAVGVSSHGYIRDKNPAFSVNESHGLDYYQMYGP
jgi:hypothetical protein